MSASQSFGITGQHGVSLNVAGQPIPIFPQDGIHLLAIQNVGQVLPTLQMRLLDFYGLYTKGSPINDGTILNLAFNDGNTGLPPSVAYRAFGTPVRKAHNSGYDELIVTATLDNLSYVRETVNRGMPGSSTSVMGTIASTLNMKYVTNDTSNDSMTWLPGRGTWAKFASNISKHAYSDEMSAFSHAVTESNTLMFINLQKLFSNKSYKAVFYKGAMPKDKSETAFAIHEEYAENNSGLLNHLYGYGMRQGQTSGTGQANIYTAAKATYPNGSSLDIDKASTQSLKNRSRIQVAPLDCGNSHPNFITAKHQNARLKSTYSQVQYVTTQLYTGLTLYDVVRVLIYNQGVINLTKSGTYCVTGISRGIAGVQYFEKLQLESTGPSNINPSLY